MSTGLIDTIKRLKAIADTGLLYATTEYDKERYTELLETSIRLMCDISGHPVEDLKMKLVLAKDYPTAKVDIRGIVLREDKKMLMVKESSDKKWSLPGVGQILAIVLPKQW